MAICNRLSVSYNFKNIDADYDFYMISTCDKFIPFGAKCLDISNGIRAESIAFENGRSMYVLTRKGVTNRIELTKNLNDEKLSIKKIDPNNIPSYLLFRLFLYSLNNFESDKLSFNNLTGKFYIYNPAWMKKNRSSFIAIGINVDQNMNITLEAATFAKLSLFKENKKLNEYPKYIFANKNNALKRVFDKKVYEEIYIKKGIFNKKAEIPFLSLDQKNVRDSKVFFLYYVLDLMSKKCSDYLSFSFSGIDVLSTIGTEKDNNFIDVASREFSRQDVTFVNLTSESEYIEEFKDLVKAICCKVEIKSLIGEAINDSTTNIVLIHNKEFYEQNKYQDLYKSFNRKTVIQCITVEDSAEKIIDDNEAIINSIIKEVVIKNDIINKGKISLDDWNSYGFETDYIFGKEKDGKHYFMIVHPDGSFCFYNKTNDLTLFNVDILNDCSDYLTDNKGKEKTIIANQEGDINVITRTNRFPLPDKEIFELPTISRSREAREKYFSGLVDITLYKQNEKTYYSSSIKGSGMQAKIIRAPHLYEVDVVKGKNIMPDILAMLSVTFVKYKSFTVLPYPIKYLNEYILMCENQSINNQ